MINSAELMAQLNFPPWVILIIIAISVWAIIWKGFALWKAARKNSPIWFVALLVINTVGILEILYIFIFSKMGKREARSRRK
jgi:hypothetical protein